MSERGSGEYNYKSKNGKLIFDVNLADRTEKALKKAAGLDFSKLNRTLEDTDDALDSVIKKIRGIGNVSKEAKDQAIEQFRLAKDSISKGEKINLQIDDAAIKSAIMKQSKQFEEFADKSKKQHAEMRKAQAKFDKEYAKSAEVIEKHMYETGNVFQKKKMSDARLSAAKQTKSEIDEKRKQLDAQVALQKSHEDQLSNLETKLKRARSDKSKAELTKQIKEEQKIVNRMKKQNESDEKKLNKSEESAKSELSKAEDQAFNDLARATKVQLESGKMQNKEAKKSAFSDAVGVRGYAKAARDTWSGKADEDYIRRRDETAQAAKAAREDATAAERQYKDFKSQSENDFIAEEMQKIRDSAFDENGKQIMSDSEIREAQKAKQEQLREQFDNGDSPEEYLSQYGDQLRDLNDKSKEANLIADSQEQIAKDARSISKETLISTKQYVKNLGSQLLGAEIIKSSVNSFMEYQSSVNARLQESGITYSNILADVAKNIGMSTTVSQKSTVENIKKLVDNGIAYDVEFRGFLETIKDDIASTFDTMSESMLQIVRLQQSDSSAQRLGMEATLLKFYNSNFKNSEYLNSLFDSVQGTLMDAISSMGNDAGAATEFEFQVQKWLGSLYSLGMSNSTITSLASGINALGSGDITALNGNEPMQTLLAMSANQAGLQYAELLTKGLNASNINKFLNGMLSYLEDIAAQVKDNNVVAKAYTEVLGLSYQDLAAIRNMQSVQSNVYGTNLKYSQAMQEYTNQASQISSRKDITSKINTLMENVTNSVALTIGGDTGLYSTFLLTSLFKDITGGIDLPFINVFGSGLDLNTTVADLLLNGMIGLSFLSSLIGTFTGGEVGTKFNPSAWGYSSVVSRGGGLTFGGSGTQSSTSGSTDFSSTTNQSSSDLENSTLSKANDESKSKSEIINAGLEPEKTIEDIRDELFEDTKKPLPVKIISDDNDAITLTDLYETLFYNRVPILTQEVDPSVTLLDYLGVTQDDIDAMSTAITDIPVVTESAVSAGESATGSGIESILTQLYGDVADREYTGKTIFQRIKNLLSAFFGDDGVTEGWSTGMAKMYLTQTAAGLGASLKASDIAQILSDKADLEDYTYTSGSGSSSGGSGGSSGGSSGSSRSSSGGGSGSSGGSYSSGGSGSSGSGGSSSSSSATNYSSQLESIVKNQTSLLDYFNNIKLKEFISNFSTSSLSSSGDSFEVSATDIGTLMSNTSQTTDLIKLQTEEISKIYDFMSSIDLSSLASSIESIEENNSEYTSQSLSSSGVTLADSMQQISQFLTTNSTSSLLGTSEVLKMLDDISQMKNALTSDSLFNNLQGKIEKTINSTSNDIGTVFRQVFTDADYSTNNYTAQISLTDESGTALLEKFFQLRNNEIQKVEVTNSKVTVDVESLPQEITNKIEQLVNEKLATIISQAIKISLGDESQSSMFGEGGLITTLQNIESSSKNTANSSDDIYRALQMLTYRSNM